MWGGLLWTTCVWIQQIIFPNKHGHPSSSERHWRHSFFFLFYWPSSLVHTCAGRWRNSECLRRYSSKFLGKCPCCPMWIMRKFHSGAEEDKQMKKCSCVCTTNNTMLWQAKGLLCIEQKRHCIQCVSTRTNCNHQNQPLQKLNILLL